MRSIRRLPPWTVTVTPSAVGHADCRAGGPRPPPGSADGEEREIGIDGRATAWVVLEVEVVHRRVARAPDVSDHRSNPDAPGGAVGRQVRVVGPVAARSVHDHGETSEGVRSLDGVAGLDGDDRRAVRGDQVGPLVDPAPRSRPAEGVDEGVRSLDRAGGDRRAWDGAWAEDRRQLVLLADPVYLGL